MRRSTRERYRILSEDEYQKWYAGIRDRYRATRQALMQAGLAELNMVERIVIDELPPGPAGMPGMWRLTPADAASLRGGLAALVKAFHLDADTDQSPSRKPIPPPANVMGSLEPEFERSRRARAVSGRLDIIFTPERDGRPSDEALSYATNRLLGRSSGDDPC